MSKNSVDGLPRRNFVAGSLASFLALGLPEWFAREAAAAEQERLSASPKKFAANDHINIACIGCGGSKAGFRQGIGDTHGIAGHPGVKCVAVCDVDATHLEEAAAGFGGTPRKYSDFRELLAQPDIDAVVIGTPDHWHAYVASAAMKAGKDVYCEKPLTLTIDEGHKLVNVWKRTGRVFQTGSQQRSDSRFRLACELVRNKRLGKLSRVEAHLPGGATGGPFPVLPVPQDFNWDFWLGPAPMADYCKERTHGSFRNWLEYSGGMMTDWGAHHNDIAQWGLGMDRSGPIAIEAIGTRNFGHNCYNAFQEFEVTYTYPDNIILVSSNHGDNGVKFEGEKGWIFVSREHIRASDEDLLTDPLPSDAIRLYKSNDHHGNFIECMRKRTQPICDCEIGYRSVSVCHLGGICMRLGGRRLEWDPAKEEFKNDKEANALRSRPIRGHWRV
jgi:predicted dehydrogenase